MKDINRNQYKLQNNEEKELNRLLELENKEILKNERLQKREFNKLSSKMNNLKDIMNVKKLSKYDQKIINQQMNEDKIVIKNDLLQIQYNKNINSTDIKIYDDNISNVDITNEYMKLKSNLKSIINNNSDIQTISNYFNNTDIRKINQIWDNIKNSYIKQYDVYNPVITNKQVIEFLKDKIGNILLGEIKNEPVEIKNEPVEMINQPVEMINQPVEGEFMQEKKKNLKNENERDNEHITFIKQLNNNLENIINSEVLEENDKEQLRDIHRDINSEISKNLYHDNNNQFMIEFNRIRSIIRNIEEKYNLLGNNDILQKINDLNEVIMEENNNINRNININEAENLIDMVENTQHNLEHLKIINDNDNEIDFLSKNNLNAINEINKLNEKYGNKEIELEEAKVQFLQQINKSQKIELELNNKLKSLNEKYENDIGQMTIKNDEKDWVIDQLKKNKLLIEDNIKKLRQENINLRQENITKQNTIDELQKKLVEQEGLYNIQLQKILTLKKEITNNSKSLHDKNSQIEQLKIDNEQLKQKNKDILNEINEKRDLNVFIIKELKNKMNENELQNERKINLLEQELINLQKNITKKEEIIEQLKDKLLKIELEISEVKLKSSNKDVKIKDFEQQIEKIKNEQIDMISKYGNNDKETKITNNELTKKITFLEEKIINLEKNIEEKNINIIKLGDLIQGLNNDIEKAKKDINNKDLDINEKQNKINELQNKIDKGVIYLKELEKQESLKNNEREEIIKKLSDANDEINKLKNEVLNKDKQINELDNLLKNLNKEIEKAKIDIKDKDVKINEKEQIIKNLDNTLKSGVIALEKFEEQNNLNNNEREEIIKKLNDANDEINKLKNEVLTKNKQINILRNDIEELKKDINREKKNNDVNIETKKKNIEELQEQLNSVKQNYDELDKKKKNEFKDELDKLKNEINELKKLVDEKEKQIIEFKENNNKLNEKIDVLNVDLNKFKKIIETNELTIQEKEKYIENFIVRYDALQGLYDNLNISYVHNEVQLKKTNKKIKELEEKITDLSTEVSVQPLEEEMIIKDKEIDETYEKIKPKFNTNKSYNNINLNNEFKDKNSHQIYLFFLKKLNVFINKDLYDLLFLSKNKRIYYFYFFRFCKFSIIHLIRKFSNGESIENDNNLNKIIELFKEIKETKESLLKSSYTKIKIYDINNQKNYTSTNGFSLIEQIHDNEKPIILSGNKKKDVDDIVDLFINKKIITIDNDNNNTVKFDNSTHKQPFPHYEYNKELLSKNLYGGSIKKKIEKRKNELLHIGGIYILKNKLINDNILAIRDENNYRYKNLSNKKVSDDMIDIIIKLNDKNNITQKDINKLNDYEKDLYNLIIKISKLNKTQYNDIDDTKNKLKNRYDLIIGEIESGNNNSELLIQFKDILEQLHHMKMINNKKLNEHYNEIKNNYFK
jgi:hypothetical protein